MRGKGINYDTGFSPGGKDSRPGFTAQAAREEMRVIAEELHCTAVRISGGVPERLSAAARAAAEAGLDVWFSPFPCELDTDELRPFFADCARRAEEIRRSEAVRRAGSEVVLVLGCELTLFAHGFIPGATGYDRIAALTSGDQDLYRRIPEIGAALGAFLARCAADAREEFGGPLTYASGVWEHVDWTPFDYVAVDAYRDAHNAGTYGDEIRAHVRHGKPLVVSEFGCCTYQGAGDRGGLGWAITKDGRIDGAYVRDEGEQVRYLRELLAVFEEAGVDSAFWFTFAGFGLPHHPTDPELDLDMAAYGVMKVLADGGQEPKEVFHALADAYRT
ncbi:hypothetical protein AB0M29_21980 [Streptomyces sp. NPDC051976]|uniref:hypothetical protein n=1 Tax=Streptomyces sp. NPDC051976 TaxID=3154947 RepID=UPI00343AAE98